MKIYYCLAVASLFALLASAPGIAAPDPAPTPTPIPRRAQPGRIPVQRQRPTYSTPNLRQYPYQIPQQNQRAPNVPHQAPAVLQIQSDPVNQSRQRVPGYSAPRHQFGVTPGVPVQPAARGAIVQGVQRVEVQRGGANGWSKRAPVLAYVTQVNLLKSGGPGYHRALEFSVRDRPAPTLVVDRVHYFSPRYAEVDERLGHFDGGMYAGYYAERRRPYDMDLWYGSYNALPLYSTYYFPVDVWQPYYREVLVEPLPILAIDPEPDTLAATVAALPPFERVYSAKAIVAEDEINGQKVNRTMDAAATIYERAEVKQAVADWWQRNPGVDRSTLNVEINVVVTQALASDLGANREQYAAEPDLSDNPASYLQDPNSSPGAVAYNLNAIDQIRANAKTELLGNLIYNGND